MRNTTEPTPELITTSEVARRLNRCEATVRRWADEGRIPVERDGNNRRLFRSSNFPARRRR